MNRWHRIVMCSVLLAAAVAAMFADCHGWAFLYSFGSMIVWFE